MDDARIVTCPYCFEAIELWIDPGTQGEYVEDCEVCCRPWRVIVRRDAQGRPSVDVDRAQ